MLWLQVDFPAGQLLWISWPPAKKQKHGTERWLWVSAVSPDLPVPAAAGVAAAHRSQDKRSCKQGLPGAIPSWHSSAACALSPPATSQKILLYKTHDCCQSLLWSKENKLNWVTLCGGRIALFYPPRVLTLHPSHHVRLMLRTALPGTCSLCWKRNTSVKTSKFLS